MGGYFKKGRANRRAAVSTSSPVKSRFEAYYRAIYNHYLFFVSFFFGGGEIPYNNYSIVFPNTLF